MNNNILGTEKIPKLIAKFAVPCVISMLVNSLYNIVDQIFIGQGVGYLGNAATNVAFPFSVISMSLALLCGDGGAAFYSLMLGRGEKEEASKGVGTALTAVTIFSIIMFLVCFNLRRPLLEIFGATGQVMDYAMDYSTIIIIGLPFVMITTAFNSIIRADGSPKYAMVSMLSGAIINTILDPIFIFVLDLSVKGAAYATVIGQLCGFLITVSYFKRFKSINFHLNLLKIKFSVCKRVLSLGLSSFFTQVAMVFVIVILNNALKDYGAMSEFGSEIPLAAHGIVMKVNQIIMSIIIGISVGSQPIIGYNYGARNYDRAAKTYFTAIKIVTCFTVVGSLIFFFTPDTIIQLFGQEEELYNVFARKCFRIFLAFIVLNGIQISTGIFFQAIGKPLKAAIISLSRQVVFFIPSALILPRIFGLDGCLYAGPVSDFSAFTLSLILIIIELKHIKKLKTENQ